MEEQFDPRYILNKFRKSSEKDTTVTAYNEILRKAARQAANIDAGGGQAGEVGIGEQILPYSGGLFGTSRFEGMPISELEDVPEYAAKTQSTTEKWANATGKFALIAGTTFLDGTLGTVWGLS